MPWQDLASTRTFGDTVRARRVMGTRFSRPTVALAQVEQPDCPRLGPQQAGLVQGVFFLRPTAVITSSLVTRTAFARAGDISGGRPFLQPILPRGWRRALGSSPERGASLAAALSGALLSDFPSGFGFRLWLPALSRIFSLARALAAGGRFRPRPDDIAKKHHLPLARTSKQPCSVSYHDQNHRV